MKQRKRKQDGIRLYPPPEQKTASIPLAAVHLPAVWFLALSWWQSLTSVLPIETDSLRLYAICFLFSAVFALLWNVPFGAVRKGAILLLLFCAAVSWIRRHLDAAVNVLNLTANAYLAVQWPDASPYPIRPVPGPEMAWMFAVFLLPLLFLWSLLLHLRHGKWLAFVLLLAPAAFSLAITQVPSETSCWLILLSGAVYAAVFGCQKGRAALTNGLTAAAALTLMVLLCALASRPLEPCKQPPDGFYALTRESIETEWIRPLQDSYTQAKIEWNARRQARLEEETNPEDVPPDGPDTEHEPDSENTLVPETGPDGPNGLDAENNPDGQNSLDRQPDPDLESFERQLQTESNSSRTEHGTNAPYEDYSGASGSIGTFPDLGALSRFRPGAGPELTVALQSKPEDTVYYPAAYGVIYQDSRWIESSPGSMQLYLQYPGGLERLKTLCQENPPRTLSDASDFIQKEFEAHTEYDYEPGPTPAGKDFAEYFLFDSQKGFCVHFATTAVLMYRMCGFPARYVQGYAVPASAFRRQEDGSYAAAVTGEMGHAWCEVSQNGEWILKEHTLPYYGARPLPGVPAASGNGRSWVPNAAGRALQALKVCAAASACFLAAALLLFFQAALRRQHRSRRFHAVRRGAGIQRMYHAIYETAVFLGMEQADILSYRGFQALRDFLTEIPPDSLEWLYRTVLEILFYQKTATKEDTRQAWKIYRQFSRRVKENLSPAQKWIYCYIKANVV